MHTPADYQKLLDVALATFAADHTVKWLEPHIEDDLWQLREMLSGNGLNNHYYEDPVKLILQLPKPMTANCLFIALHEIGHVVLEPIQAELQNKLEFCASLWAKGYMAAHNIPVPPAIWATALANAQTH